MMPADDDHVTLHVYELLPEQQQQQQQQSGTASFFARMLSPMGLGAYHTCLEIRGYYYTFAAGSGISKVSSRQHSLAVPPRASFRESIFLGICHLNRGKLNEIVNILSRDYFSSTAYHLVHRNCNHFTETFATALLLADRLVEDENVVLNTYPKWVNRLAKSGVALGVPENASSKTVEMTKVTSCNVMEEARRAVRANEKVGWGLSSSSSFKSKKSASSKKKRELTEKQKAALAKLKKNTKS